MRRRFKWLPFVGLGFVSLLLASLYLSMIAMPGRSYDGEPPADETALNAKAARLRADVEMLAIEIGERNTRRPVELARSADYLERRLEETGFEVRRESFPAGGTRCDNLIAEQPGTGPRWLVVGAHYDSARGSPGANDNGTGVAALLELAREFSGKQHRHGLRFVLFTNEEPPYFQTAEMGSRVHVRHALERHDDMVAMISLETMGHFDDEPGSQHYPSLVSALYPNQGNFLAFVGDMNARSLVRATIGRFRQDARIPSEGAALPKTFPGVNWSDHASFWGAGVPALMITDTALFRSGNYHTANDSIAEIDFARLAEATRALGPVLVELLSGSDF